MNRHTVFPRFVAERVYEHHLHEGVRFWANTVDYSGPVPLDIHMHEGIELAVLLEGEYDMTFGTYHLAAKPGDLWLVGMWEPHAHGTLPPLVRTISVAVLIFLPEFVGDEMLGNLPWLSLLRVPPSQRPRVTSPEMREAVLGIGREIHREISEKRPAWQTMVRLDLLRLLVTVSRDWTPPKPIRITHSDVARIVPALTLAHAMPPRRVSAEEAAAACGFSRSRFDSIFQQVTGLTFGRFCLRSRLAYVAHQLLNTDLSVGTVGELAGFVDSSHLHRSFVKSYGCTPAYYRRHGSLLPTNRYDTQELTASTGTSSAH